MFHVEPFMAAEIEYRRQRILSSYPRLWRRAGRTPRTRDLAA